MKEGKEYIRIQLSNRVTKFLPAPSRDIKCTKVYVLKKKIDVLRLMISDINDTKLSLHL